MRKKKWARRSCRFTTGAIRVVDDRHIQLPRIGQIRTKEQATKLVELLDAGTARILSATVSKEAGRWFVSFGCELERGDAPASKANAVVGVDLGVTHLAALSTGEIVENPRALSRYARRMVRLQRELSRRQKGSKRRAQTNARIARTHVRVANLRRDELHKLTTQLVRTYGTIVIEDLNVAGMTAAPKPKPDGAGGHERNGRRAKAGLNRAILDVAPGEFRRQLTYKLEWNGGTLIVANRYFRAPRPGSSCGGVRAKLSLATRTYRCACGLEIDRDLNAARNLAAYGRRVLSEQHQHHAAGSGPETLNARGGGHPRRQPKPPVKREDGTGLPGRTVTAASQGAAA
ncbi:MAG: transposase [Acidimicrobiaceae bacterium]|nr:transposase [Acidimicrobiaceae bacterium]